MASGSISAMIHSNKMNRELQKHAKNNYRDKLEELNNISLGSEKKFNSEKFKSISKSEKERIKSEVRKELKNQIIKSYTKTFVTVLIILLIVWILYREFY